MNTQDQEASHSNARRYRILNVIGRGGFGTVYRARMESSDGFTKDVAIKLLAEDEHFPKDVLQRFRDEARILGLVRDRAIVTVDPPTRLAGRWAVVMEFVDGASCERLLRLGTFPPTVGLDVVEEVARALHKIYRHPGADGQPLKLLHRDLKPGNIQITPSGEVKVLDFGIARADFAAREANTTINIGGTLGYIAPERLHGVEGPEGDVYSLGVVLHKLCMGANPPEDDGWREGDALPSVEPGGDATAAILVLSRQMRAPKPNDRPTARELQRMVRLLREQLGGELLRDWAERVVPSATTLASDELVGETLTETLSEVSGPPPAPQTASGAPPTMILALTPFWVFVGTALIGLVLITGTLAVYRVMQLPSEIVIRESSAPALDGRVTVEPVPQATPAPAPEPAPSLPAPQPAVVPVPSVAAAPVSAPRPAQAEEFTVTISSVPLGAEVILDGKAIGVTPMPKLPLQEGKHTLKLVLGSDTVEHEVQVGRMLATRYLWRVKEGTWEAGQ